MTTTEFNQSLLDMKSGLERFACSLTNNKSDADDLVQDTFLKALINKEKFENNTNLKAWAYTIMRNTFINNYRRKIRINTIVDQTNDAYYLNTSSGSPFGMPQAELNYKEITATVKQLDDHQRIPFEMQRVGYKYEEIADELNISIGTVKSRIFFGRKKLMYWLKDYAS